MPGITLPLPAALAGLLAVLGPLFTAPAFRTFCRVGCGFLPPPGHNLADIGDRQSRAPRYTTKAQPSTADMAAKFRRVIIVARFRPSRPDQPTPEEIRTIRLAWEDLAA
jgi:hypothetical protein